jgi:Tfp pilus assembly protein PilN
VPTNRVIVELSPSHLRVAQMRGSSLGGVRCERLSVKGFTEGWPGVLASIRPTLTTMVEGLGATGAEATLLYSGPTAATGVFSCPQGQGGASVMKAAGLALAEAAGFPLASNPHDLTRLATDKPNKAAATAAQGNTLVATAAQVHTLGVAETEASAQALSEWLTAAGLKPMVTVPIETPAVAAAADRAMELSAAGPVSLVFYAGEHGSVLAAAAAGQLKFVRQIALGTESLVEAMSREVRTSAPDHAAVTLDASEAGALLFSVGVPRRDQVVDAARGINGDAILPLLQPTLQRVVVEVKQSLRFSLSEQEREQARLYGIGPGAAVPRLVELIAEQAGLKLEKSESTGNADGNIGAWVRRPLGVNLLPRSLSGQRMTTRLQRCLWAGVAAALALVAVDAVMTRTELSQLVSERTTLKGRLDAAKSSTEVQAKLIDAQAGLASAKERMSARLDGSASWDAAMVMLSQKTPDSVRLSQVQFMMDNDQPVCKLSGQAPLAEQGKSTLQVYMDALAAVPIVKECKLGATTRGEESGDVVQNFEMTLVLVDLPASDPSFAAMFGAATGEKEGTP